MKKSLILISILLLTSFNARGNETSICNKILYVGGSGPGNYTTIQFAIDNATNGDIVFIYNGTYYETLWINKSLSVIGEDTNTTIIDGKLNENISIFSVNTSYFNLRGVTIQNSQKYSIILKNTNKQSTITDCSISHNKRGIGIFSSFDITIKNCFIKESLDGIILSYSNNCSISNCKINMDQFGINIGLNCYNNTINYCEVVCNNDSIYGGYGCSYYSDNNRIYNSTFKYCMDGLGISGNNTLIQNCTFDQNRRNGISLNEGEYNTISNCHIQNNGYNSPLEAGNGILCYFGSHNLIDECIISNNNGCGITFSYWASENTVTKSTIERNGFSSDYEAGIRSRSSNRIYLNNIIGNYIQASDYYSNSVWDNGKYGNFWSDYAGPDWNRDAIGDKPYQIFNNSQDNFPLLCPYNKNGPSVLIERPAHFKGDFVYLRNLRILKSKNTLLIGNIQIKACAINYDNPEKITKIEFYVDGILRHVDFLRPFTWYWRLCSPLNHQHTISVMAYDNKGRAGQDSCSVLKVF